MKETVTALTTDVMIVMMVVMMMSTGYQVKLNMNRNNYKALAHLFNSKICACK